MDNALISNFNKRLKFNLSVDDTNMLIDVAKEGGEKGDVAFETLISSNLGLIFKVQSQFYSYFSPVFDSDDLSAVALKGFFRAVQLFDKTRNIKFSTYVVNSMKFEIWQALRSVAYTIHIPIKVQREKYRLSKYLNTFEQSKTSVTKDKYLAENSGLNLNRVNYLFSLPKVDVYFESPVFSDSDLEFSEVIAEKKDEINLKENQIDMEIFINYISDFLSKKEIHVLVNYYSLISDKQSGKTFSDLASEMGVSRQRVENIHKSALSKLREPYHRAYLSKILTGNGRYK